MGKNENRAFLDAGGIFWDTTGLMTKRVAILGSTGSIGQNALQVIEALAPEYEVAALSAHCSGELLARQANRFRPAVTAITHPEYEPLLRAHLNGYGGRILCGPGSLEAIASDPETDIVLCAVVGAAGLPAVLAAARAGKVIAIANKEPLVIAGELLTREAKASGAMLLPIDSEHSAVFQAMQAGRPEEVRRIVLTASGGPFRTKSREAMERATVQEALDHPTWQMGPKITIDSATMMNKALEVIEAHWLFGMPVDRIDVLINPESVIHSMVEFVDGSVVAQLGTPDMKTPIQYALTYPQRRPGVAERLNLEAMGRLTFEGPDPAKFRALALGYEVARIGGSAPVVFNAANEAAVEAFLKGAIRFGQIVDLIERCLEAHEVHGCSCLEELLETDQWARRQVRHLMSPMKTI